MRELRGAELVTVSHVPTEQNPADLFTKILPRAVFEKHRATVMNSKAELKAPEGEPATREEPHGVSPVRDRVRAP